ncbi:MAG: sodium ion-translocating decarboxylase subunit beta [Clostridia bacterium]
MLNFFTTLPSNMLVDSLKNLWESTGFMTSTTPIWQNLIMMLIACVLIYLAVAKEFEPNLLLAIGFGMFIINIPGAYNILYGTAGYTALFQGTAEQLQALVSAGIVNESGVFLTGAGGVAITGTLDQLVKIFGVDASGSYLAQLTAVEEAIRNTIGGFQTQIANVGALGGVDLLKSLNLTHEVVADQGMFFYLYKGVEWVIYPPLIFLGIGAMTDFGPLIANPKSLLMGAAAQLGIFVTFIIAINIGFTGEEAAAIGIIGGADGPTAIYVTTKLAAHLLPAIAVAAYSYMALIKVIQPPIMRLMTTKKERSVVMEQLRPVSKLEKVVFPIAVTGIVGIILPSAIPLLGMLMLGNLMKESNVVPRLTNTAKNEIINIVTILLGLLVGTKATADVFLTTQTLLIILIGVFAFAFGTVGGLLIGKIMCKLSHGKINPLIGAAGVSAVPMAARIAHNVGQEENPNNYLLMHAMGPNVAGVIGSAVAAGVLLAIFA